MLNRLWGLGPDYKLLGMKDVTNFQVAAAVVDGTKLIWPLGKQVVFEAKSSNLEDIVQKIRSRRLMEFCSVDQGVTLVTNSQHLLCVRFPRSGCKESSQSWGFTKLNVSASPKGSERVCHGGSGKRLVL